MNNEYIRVNDDEFLIRNGFSKINCRVDINEKVIYQGKMQGLYFEEAINTYFENIILNKIFEEELKVENRFSKSLYYEIYIKLISEIVEKIGINALINSRFYGNDEKINEISKKFFKLEFFNNDNLQNIILKKKEIISLLLEEDVEKIEICFSKYDKLFLVNDENEMKNIINYVDKVFEELYILKKYVGKFDFDESIHVNYEKMVKLIESEIYTPIDEYNKNYNSVNI